MPTHAELIHNWRLSKLRLAAAKKAEMEWRIACCAMFFANPIIGTNTSEDGLLKLVLSETFTVEKDIPTLFARMRTVAFEFKEETTALNLLLDMKPSLNKAAYDALSPLAQKALVSVITIKPSAPQLTYKGEKDE